MRWGLRSERDANLSFLLFAGKSGGVGIGIALGWPWVSALSGCIGASSARRQSFQLISITPKLSEWPVVLTSSTGGQALLPGVVAVAGIKALPAVQMPTPLCAMAR